jgi:hypothetical protein
MVMVFLGSSAVIAGIGRDAAVETLAATAALPAHITSMFADPIGYVEASSGESIVLDRRAHAVYVVEPDRKGARKLFEIGVGKAELLAPGALSIGPNDFFAVSDAPGGRERIQYFSLRGTFLGGFYLDTLAKPRLAVGSLILNGVGSMTFTGRTFLLSDPEHGALIAELDTSGAVLRRIGVPRRTAHEADADLHVALNLGVPLAVPGGGFYFVFQTGAPAFRKFDATGTLVFERHIEGVELDSQVQSLPTTWPRRPDASGRLPIVPPLVRTAAVDPEGRLWVSLTTGTTYVYDNRGDKIRTVQFKGASLLSPTSLFFAARHRVLVTPGCYEFSSR